MSRIQLLLLLAGVVACARIADAVMCDWSPHPNSPLNEFHDDIISDLTLLRTAAGGQLYSAGTNADDAIKVLYLSGSMYDMGYAQGVLLADDINALMPAQLAHFADLVASGALDLSNETAAMISKVW